MILMGIDIRFCSKQKGRGREREKRLKKQHSNSSTVEQYLCQWVHALLASFPGSSPACVVQCATKAGEEEPRNYVLTSPELNLRVPDVAVKCVPATAGSKVN